MTGIIAILVALLVIPPSVQLWLLWRAGSSWMRGAMFLFTLPPVLAMAFPFAVMGGVDAIRRHSLPTHVARAAALKLGVFAALFMLVYGGWVAPFANQASLRVMNPPGMAAPLKSMRELTTAELVFDPARATVFAPGTYLASRSASIQRELNGRSAMIVMPLVLLWLRWRAYDTSRRGWPLTAWFAIPIAIGVLSTAINSGAWLEREWHLWDGSRSWMPIVVFALWGMVSSYGRRPRPDAPVEAR